MRVRSGHLAEDIYRVISDLDQSSSGGIVEIKLIWNGFQREELNIDKLFFFERIHGSKSAHMLWD